MMAGGAPRVLLDGRKARDFGIGRYVTGLAAGLAALGDVELSVLALPGDELLFPAGVRTIPCPSSHYSLGELLSVGRAARQEGPDLFHAPHYVVPFGPPLPTVVTIHDLMHLTRPEHSAPAKRLYARWMISRATRLAARVLTVSGASRQEIEERFPRARGKVRVVPNGVDPAFLSPPDPADEERVRQRFGLGSSPFVLFLGNDKPHKNLARLLDAWRSLEFPPDEERPLLVLAGGAAERASERRAALAARGLKEVDVRDLGVVNERDVAPLLSAARLLAFPSLAEGFGLPALEAQAAGTPLLCSRRGGLPEAAGEAALYVDPESPASIAEGLGRLLSGKALRRRLAGDGRRHAAAFTWEAAARRTLAVYREALGEAAPGPPATGRGSR